MFQVSKELYEKAKTMSPQEIIKHIKEAKSDEERIFYASIANAELQKRHREVIEKNLF